MSLALWVPGLPLACAGRPVAPAPARTEAPSAVPVASATAVPAPASSSAVAATCPPGQTLGADGSCAASTPCVDGELLMGTCICSHGKGADATGHCVFMPCPKSTSGGTVFRNEEGQCVECRAGAVRSGDGCLK